MGNAASRVAGVVLVLSGLGASTVVGVSGGGAQTAPDAAAARVVAAARTNLGDTYRWGGTGPDAWDCSGLTSVLWRTAGGVSAIPRTSRDQQAWAWPMRAADARPGDLVFFGNPVTHVGIYAGDGRIVDASSSRKAVVERAVWSDPTIRYGRVPRPGVAKPVPPPAPKPSPSAAPSPSPSPAGKAATPPAQPGAGKPGKPAPAKPVLRPIPPAGHTPRTATTREMAAFVAALRTRAGARWGARATGPDTFDAAGLVRWAWARSGYGVLPTTPDAIERLARPVALRDLAVGDLVLYGAPAVHVAVYVGNGRMIDASKVLRTVSERRVFASQTVRFARLVPRRA
ncbi:MAG TPA: NlpC/P60 family protein [Mycobacteriales bacterium]|jgi:cell wall-associated NlpC family hydrolase